MFVQAAARRVVSTRRRHIIAARARVCCALTNQCANKKTTVVRHPVIRGTAGRASGDEDVCQRPAIARHFRTRIARRIAASVICGESLPAAARGGAGRDDRASIR